MCVSTGGGFSRVLNPFGLPLNVIDPGGSLVNKAVTATGIGGAPGALLRGATGLEGTINESKNAYNKTYNPSQPTSADPALAGANTMPKILAQFDSLTVPNASPPVGSTNPGARANLTIPSNLPPGQTSSGLFIPQG